MKKLQFPHSLIAALLVLACLLGLLPTVSFAANSDTIKMIDCDLNGVTYVSPTMGTCYLHLMHVRFVP